MIAQLGHDRENLTVILDCAGGYFVEISLHTYSLIPDGESVNYTPTYGA
jgi:Holliday junction DNA helicase RuvA